MSKYLRELDICADRQIVDEFKDGFVHRFARQSYCVTGLYRSLLKRTVATNDIGKILITCVNAALVRNAVPDIDAPCAIKWPFRFREYVQGTDVEKKTMLADTLRDCLLLCAEKWHWDKSAIIQLDAQARAKSLRLEGTSKASWPSPDGKHRVRVDFVWNLDSMELTAVLYRNRTAKVLARKKLGDMVSGWAQLHYSVGSENGRWISDVDFQLITTDWLQKSWTANFSDTIHAEDQY